MKPRNIAECRKCFSKYLHEVARYAKRGLRKKYRRDYCKSCQIWLKWVMPRYFD